MDAEADAEGGVDPRPDDAVRRGDRHAADLRTLGAVLAGVLWLAVGADVVAPGPLGRFSGFTKGNDFVQFYVAGRLALAGDFDALVSPERLREAERPYLPPGSGAAYPPVYGPAVALLFAPLATLSYLWAYGVWAALTLAALAYCALAAAALAPSLGRWPGTTLVLAAAYPPVAYLVLAGQVSALGCLAMTGAAVALARGGSGWAGVWIGILAYKPSLFLPALAISLSAGAWRMSVAAIATALVTIVVPGLVAGPGVVLQHLENLVGLAGQPDLLVTNRFLMVSLRTFWLPLLPNGWAAGAYVVTAALAVAVAAAGWRSSPNPLNRVALLGLGTVLASPHLFLYDLALLIPAYAASARVLLNAPSRLLGVAVVGSFLAPLAAPVAAYGAVHPVTVSLVVWLLALVRAGRRDRGTVPT